MKTGFYKAFLLTLAIGLGLSFSGQAETVKEALDKMPQLDRSSSISGPDTDHNGVRDDIDSYIDSLSDTSEQKMALRQEARAVNSALAAGSQSVPETTLKDVSIQIGRAVNCIFHQYDPIVAHGKVEAIEKFMVNTRTRFNAYDQYNTKRSGTSSRMPSGDSCENK